MSKRKQYSPKQKINLVLNALSYPDGISAFCRKNGKKYRQLPIDKTIIEQL